jgi:DNA-binding XRE family transcriptional regulator
MNAQIVEIGGQKMAMLPVADYERLLDIAEDKADALSAEHAERRRTEGEEYLSLEMVDRILAGENALRVWRKHRGMTLEQLATLAGIRKSFLSTIENGKSRGAPSLWRRLARALNVSADDILPEG